MRVFHIPRNRFDVREPEFSTPWADGHASPEDRALGLELELIELLRRRELADEGSAEARDLELEIEGVRRELVSVAVMPDLPQVA